MTNGGIIEGHTKYSGFSDLSLAIGYAGQQYCTDERRAETQHTATSIWGGHRMVDRKIGNPTAEKEARLRSQHFTLLGCCLGNTKGNAAACVLAGHHHSPSRNRIKTGHYFFGGGETRMQMQVISGGIRGPSEVLRHLAPN